eukprot:6315746-Prymnesium_polylepis.1
MGAITGMMPSLRNASSVRVRTPCGAPTRPRSTCQTGTEGGGSAARQTVGQCGAWGSRTQRPECVGRSAARRALGSQCGLLGSQCELLGSQCELLGSLLGSQCGLWVRS